MKKSLLKLMLMVFILSLSACGGGSSSGGGGGVTPDNGDRVTPDQQDGGVVNGEVGVSLQPRIVLRFTAPVDLATVNQNNIYLSTTSNGTDRILVKDIVVTDEDRVVHFSPINTLLENTKYYVIVTSNVKSVTGNSYTLGSGLSFTTGDYTAPTVSILSPSSSATNVSIKPNIQLQFSEAVINVTPANVTLHKGSATGEEVAISNLTQGADNTFTTTPLEDLVSGTAYYVVVGGTITDVAGNALNSKTFNFTTSASTVVNSKPVVNILSPSNNATNVSRSNVIQLQFNEAVDNVTESTVALRKGSVTGEIVPIGNITLGNSNTFTFSATNLLDEKIRYYVVLSSGITNRQGVSLTQTTFSFTTGDFTAPTVNVLNPSNNAIKVSKTPSIQIQFSETVSNVTPANVVLHKGSATGEVVAISSLVRDNNNLFTFNPLGELDDQTIYYIVLSDAIVDLDGNKLATTEFHFTTGDFIAPTVNLLTPSNNATNVAKIPSIQLQFSEAVNNVTPSTVILRKGSATGQVVAINSLTSGNNNTYTFSPTSTLNDQTTYYIVLSDDIVDLDGNKLTQAIFSFTTGDYTAPSATIVTPSNNAINVAKIPNIQIQFNEAVNNVTSSTVTLRKGSVTGEIATLGTIVPGANNTFTFSPTSNLDEQTMYYVVLSNGITDASGNQLSATSFSFKIGDFSRARFNLIQPVDNATDVSLTPLIILKFNEPVLNVSNSTIKLHENSSVGDQVVVVPIATIESGPDNTYIITPLRSLVPNTNYYVMLDKSITDMSGNDMILDRFTEFKTGNFAVPTSTLLSPGNNATEVISTPTIKVQFGSAVKNVNSSNVKLRLGSATGSEVALSSIVGGADNTYTFSPLLPLNKGATYYIVLSNGITSLANNVPLVQTTYSFTVSTSEMFAEWVGGSKISNAPGVYGTKGVSSTSNIPSARNGSVSWTDSSGNMWLFGGAVVADDPRRWLNDLWKYNPSNNTWTWVSGQNTGYTYGVYGTKGVPSASNIPSGRFASISWTDSSGNMWLFGGVSTGASTLNDLWKYNPVDNTWTWVSGSNTNAEAGVYGTKGVPSTSNAPGSRAYSISWTDSSGNLWLFGGDGYDVDRQAGVLSDLWKYNPSNNTWTWVSGSNLRNQSGVYGTKGVPSTSNIPGGRGYSTSWIDKSGNLWLFGGSGYIGKNGVLFNDLWKYNPSDNTWTWVSGSNKALQVGVYGTKGVPSTSNIPGGRGHSTSWIDSSGNMWLFGGEGYDGVDTQLGFLSDLWKYNPSNNTWTWVSGSSLRDQLGVYGIKGQLSTSNAPGSRAMSMSWIDSSNNLWLFGGVYYARADMYNQTRFNDLWKLTPNQ